ncbi:MAG: homocysteine S-methyltransferase family protein [Clostridia bacterium]|nr:homocysteine S-methyltransferase family protein [Clostridia bacterium]
MKVLEFLQRNIVVLDGGTGTLLQQAGLPLGELPERWSVTKAEVLQNIHRAYYDAGSNIVCTNTFGANTLKFSETELEEIVKAGIENARIAAAASTGKQEKFVALDIGPLGKLLKPYGDFDFEAAVCVFAKTVRLGAKYGADLVFIETMSDSLECKAAVLAAKENCELPVFVSCAYGADGKLMTGASPAAMVAMLEGLGADAVGVNCSVGPAQTAGVVSKLLEKASVPVLVKPNAGLPVSDGERLRYDIDEKQFAAYIAEFVKQGARLIGGCCGTTPAYIRAVTAAIGGMSPRPIEKKNITCVSSYTHAVEFDRPVLIGERINPTGKKRFRQALIEGDVGYVLNEGVTQQEKGAHILDVNVGAPEIDEKTELVRYVEELQAVIDLPLQLDTADPVALERAMRRYNGKPLVNSVNGKKESMDAVFPLVKKYGGAVVALTLDENGIPDGAEERVAIAEKIIAEAAKYGIEKKDILVDTLAMSVSADKNAAKNTLRALRKVKEELGVHTSLGVSNVSFGLPNRESVNANFFALALENGLSAAILNPNSLEMLKTYHAYLALSGQDENCAEYIRFASQLPVQTPSGASVASASVKQSEINGKTPLQEAIVKGLKDKAGVECQTVLAQKTALETIEDEIVPALDEIGKAYEEKRAYLPQLLMSAEAAKAAFEKIRLCLLSKGERAVKKGKIVLATVKGDIHDIGKNIVATMLENYGFEVVDLGRDVPAERVLQAVEETNAPIVGLSALMTTTLPSMAETVALLKEKTPWVKIVVGGAVLTQEYADKIGADGYAKDAIASVRFAEKVCKK